MALIYWSAKKHVAGGPRQTLPDASLGRKPVWAGHYDLGLYAGDCGASGTIGRPRAVDHQEPTVGRRRLSSNGPHAPRPTTVSLDGRCADRPGACVSRSTATSLNHGAVPSPVANCAGGAVGTKQLIAWQSHQFGKLRAFGGRFPR